MKSCSPVSMAKDLNVEVIYRFRNKNHFNI